MTASFVVKTRGEDDTAKLGASLGLLPPPLVLRLHGPLGAGKTAFVRGLVQGLPGGASLRVQSPTFALARTHSTSPPVHYLDLYRLESEEACIELVLEDLIRDEDALCCVEWADQAPGLFRNLRVLTLRFPANAESEREIAVDVEDPQLRKDVFERVRATQLFVAHAEEKHERDA